MAQDGTTAGGASYTIDNVTFPVGRTKLQSIFNAIRSTNKGSSAPDLVAGQFWVDDTNDPTWTLYLFDGTDSIQFATINTTDNTVNFIDSTFTQLTSDLSTNGNDINFGDNDKAVFGDSNDLQIYHDGSNSIIKENGTGNLDIYADNLIIRDSAGTEVKAYFDTNGEVGLRYDGNTKLLTTSTGIAVTGGITTTDNINIPDGDSLYLGDSNDLRLWHDGSNSYIIDQGTGNLYIRGGADLRLQTSTGENGIIVNENGSVEIFNDNNVKITTSSTGVTVTGTVTADGVSLGDNEIIKLGVSDDLQIYHDGSHSRIDDVGTGRLYIRGNDQVRIQKYTGEDMAVFNADGSVNLYHDNSKKIETTSTGVTVTGVVESDAPTRHSIRPSLNLDFANSKTLDPRITFTRASSGVYYDGYSSVKAEENLLTYSQDFSSSYTMQEGTLTADANTAPDGTTTAGLLTEGSSTTNLCRLSHDSTPNLEVGKSYGFSIFLKNNGTPFVHLRCSYAGSGQNHAGICVNMSTFALTTGYADGTNSLPTPTTSQATDVGNGWYRIDFTFSAVNSNLGLWVYLSDSATSTSIVGDSSSGVYIWGLQIEQRDSVTAYTPTTDYPITKYQPQLQTAQSNVARFDHNPITGESLGLLIEEPRTNVQTHSEEYDNTSSWRNFSSTITPNATVSPDGTVNAYSLSAGFIQNEYTSLTAPSANFVFSFYIKKDLSNGFRTILRNTTTSTNTHIEDIDMDNLSSNAKATHVGNDWYRYVITVSSGYTTGDGLLIYFYPNQGSTAGDSTFLWGVQLEGGQYVTSYIKTTGSQVTRSADDAVMENIDQSDWFNPREITIIGQADTTPFSATSSFNRLFEFSENAVSSVNNISLFANTNVVDRARYRVDYNGTAQVGASNYTYTESENTKFALSMKQNDFALTINGGSVATDTTCNMPVDMNTLGIGKGVSTEHLGGCIKYIKYYPKALTDNEIVDLTEA